LGFAGATAKSSGLTFTADAVIKPQIGIIADLPGTDVFNWQTGLLINTYGGKYSEDGGTVTGNIITLSVPFLGKYKFADKFFGYAGPQLSISVSATAKSKEGKAQVELAQIAYLLPRLRGWGDSLSRQVGGRAAGGAGIGGRGPGETKIETDRRRIRDKMAKLRREIAEMKVSRDTKRQERRRFNIPSVAIAGYTNAGKSSLLNKLTNAGVLVENALFATLDPTVRKSETSDGRVYTLSDTVGFVRHLPHQLIDAFKSTLEEVSGSDLIVHVVDGSHPDPFEQIRAVRLVIDEIGGKDIPEIIAINKVDIADPAVILEILRKEPNSYAFSVRTGFGIEGLLHAIESSLPRPSIEINVVIPYDRGDLVHAIHESGEIFSEQYLPEGTSIHARVNGGLAQRIENSHTSGE
jgi:GTP-binding protein HflX